MKKLVFISLTLILFVGLLIIGGCSEEVVGKPFGYKSPFIRQVSNMELKGTIEVFHSDNFESGKSSLSYFLKTNQDYVKLNFLGDVPSFSPGSEVIVRGIKSNDILNVASSKNNFRITKEVSRSSATKPSGSSSNKNVLVILFNHRNNPIQPFVKEQADDMVFINQNSVNSYYKEALFNSLTFTGEVTNWYTIPYDNTNCNNVAWASSAKSLASNDFNLNSYNKIIYIWPRTNACNFDGGAFVLGNEVFINGFNNNFKDIYVIGHELGHTFGLNHASALDCYDDNRNRVTYSDLLKCNIKEYFDVFDIMGKGGGSDAPPAHFNNYHKARISYFNGLSLYNSDNIITIDRNKPSSNIYYLYPIEKKSAGPSLIHVPIFDLSPGLMGYSLEYRQPIGYDNYYLSKSSVTPSSLYFRMSYNYNHNDVRAQDPLLLDFTPETTSYEDAGLGVGKTFTTFSDQNYQITITNLGQITIPIGRENRFGQRRTGIVLRVKIDVTPPRIIKECISCAAPEPGCNYEGGSCETCGVLVCKEGLEIV